MSRDIVRNWFVFGGYSSPGFKGSSLYDPDAPCDLADQEGDVFTSIPYPVAEKLIAAREEFIEKIEKLAEEHPEIRRNQEKPI